MAEILVVDDEIGIRELLSEILADEGHTVRLAENAAAARRLRGEQTPDLVLLDIWMPDTDGVSLLREWATTGQLTMPVVMMSGHGTIDTAVEATRIGAVDFLEKPIALQKLLGTVKKALQHEQIGQKPPPTLAALAHLPALRDFRKRLEQSSARSPTLFLRGVSGPIAELCARSLQRPRTPWLDLQNCSTAITQERLQQTAGGVIYVGDLAALGKLQQMNLAFVLERLARHDIRLVVASAQPLASLAERGWDAQLLARLGEVWLSLPDLAQHGDCVPDVAPLILTLLVDHQEVPARRLTPAALELLRQRPWRGGEAGDGGWNALQAALRNLALSALEEEIDVADVERLLPQTSPTALPPEGFAELFQQPLREARDAFEKRYFEHLLHLEAGNMTRVAERSGLERTHLYRKLKQLGVAIGRRPESA
jgi:DNA-binding NtrC family response regulator